MTVKTTASTKKSKILRKSTSSDFNHCITNLVRMFGWAILFCMVTFLINNYLTFWHAWPGEGAPFGDKIIKNDHDLILAWFQFAAYPIGVVLAGLFVLHTSKISLRRDSERISNINTFFIRAAFFAVLYVGLADALISFLRVEGLLPIIFGDEMALNLGKSLYRGPVLHIPLIIIAIFTACFSRSLGFTWLALLVIIAELMIVITRFIFSYEQVFMGDLVRFWYAALFLFASAFTLLEEGHVRVDVFYTNFSVKKKGVVNAAGSLLLGISLCWIILFVGMSSKTAIINSPILAFETTQTGFGMYVKYLMAGFLAVFAISMMIQFVSYFLSAIADIRNEPGKKDNEALNVHGG